MIGMNRIELISDTLPIKYNHTYNGPEFVICFIIANAINMKKV